MTPPHTVVYTHGGGRLGNQIIRFAHWMAWAQDHSGEVEVIDYAFWPYADYFALWREHPGCVFPLRPSAADRLARLRASMPSWLRRRGEGRDRFARLVHAAGRWRLDGQAFAADGVDKVVDLDDPKFFEEITQRKVTTCSGWRIASWRLVAEHQSRLRGFFQPAEIFRAPAEALIAGLRQTHDLIIGMLIRQSDYQTWDNGRFYFSTSQYAQWIRQLLELHPGRRVAFVVASEDWQDPACFDGLPVHLATGNPKSGGHWFENWVELSLCDFVVSVPSTFSATAAFVGGVPLWPVVAAEQTMNFDQVLADGMIGAARHHAFSRSVK